MLRLLRVLLLLSLLSAPALVRAQADPDDLALAELGIDLSHANAATAESAVAPKPTYTSVLPLDHEAGLIAKFPLLHEIKGEEAKDWGQIQNLLFKEPAAAMSSDIDVKLDELEEKFNKIDKMPVPSSIAPKGSTLMPKVQEVELGLKATLPKKQLRLMQLKNKLAESLKAKELDAKEEGKDNKKEAKKESKKLQSKSASKAESKAKVASQAKALAKASKALAKAMAKTQAAKKAVAKKVGAFKSKSKQDSSVDRNRVLATVSTVRLIEKRLSGLQTLFGRLKSHLGMDLEKEISAAATKSSNNRRSKAWQALAQEMERRQKNRQEVERKTRFAQTDMDAEADAEAESEDAAEAEADDEAMDEAESEAEAEAESESEAESETEEQSLAETGADADSNDEAESESESDADDEAEVESEAESEAELNQDAEVVEEILASFL